MSNFSRSRTRKFLYQMLYAQSFSKVEDKSFKDAFFSWAFETNLDEEYLKTMFNLILENEEFLIETLEKYAPKFDIETMDLSYIIPIFVWVVEMIILKEKIPAKVSINEAVEIAKFYWDDSARKIVNWVLNKILDDLELLQKEIKTFKKKANTKTIFRK